MDEIYKMKLHERLTPSGPERLTIIRVPGGWIYRFHQLNNEVGNLMSDSVFVPFNNGFQQRKQTVDN